MLELGLNRKSNSRIVTARRSPAPPWPPPLLSVGVIEDHLAQIAGDLCRVFGVANSAAHRDSPRAGGENVIHVVEFDSADRVGGERDFVGDLADEIEPSQLRESLRR